MKLKMKPSEKLNRRYLWIEASSKDEVEKAILDYIGILGWARAAPFFVKSEKEIILAVNREELNNVRAAFGAASGKIRVLKVSGTLKGLR